MASPIDGFTGDFDFLPSGYMSSVQNRINVKALTKEQIKIIMASASAFEKEVILQDLLHAGKNAKDKEQRNYIAVAAELFIDLSDDIQRDFLMHLIPVEPKMKLFAAAMRANMIYHQGMEKANPGSTGLTPNQLTIEASYATTLIHFSQQ